MATDVCVLLLLLLFLLLLVFLGVVGCIARPLPPAFSHSLTHSVTHSAHSTHSSHPPMASLGLSFQYLPYPPTHPPMPPTHPPTHSPTHLLTLTLSLKCVRPMRPLCAHFLCFGAATASTQCVTPFGVLAPPLRQPSASPLWSTFGTLWPRTSL